MRNSGLAGLPNRPARTLQFGHNKLGNFSAHSLSRRIEGFDSPQSGGRSCNSLRDACTKYMGHNTPHSSKRMTELLCSIVSESRYPVLRTGIQYVNNVHDPSLLVYSRGKNSRNGRTCRPKTERLHHDDKSQKRI